MNRARLFPPFPHRFKKNYLLQFQSTVVDKSFPNKFGLEELDSKMEMRINDFYSNYFVRKKLYFYPDF